VSGKLYPVAKEERKAAAVRFLREIKVQRNDLFMPFDSNTIIRGIKPETAAPMQSAAKCPILVAFDVTKKLPESEGQETEVETSEAAIFKVGDDCRQDVLALQVVELVKKKFDEIGLPLPLVPYGVLPTGHECGIIQVVPNSKSRAQLVREDCFIHQ
jgi:phosphatidylinositol 4-kinase